MESERWAVLRAAICSRAHRSAASAMTALTASSSVSERWGREEAMEGRGSEGRNTERERVSALSGGFCCVTSVNGKERIVLMSCLWHFGRHLFIIILYIK